MIVIWGAGRIGRGFVADLFAGAGTHPIFVDQSADLIAQLRQQGRVTVVRAAGEDRRSDAVIDDFTALSTAETGAVADAVVATNLVAVAVFPKDFAGVAQQLAAGLMRRRAERPAAPLDVILCTNLPHAGPAFREALTAALSPEARSWAAKRVGIVESLVIRMVAEPPAAALAQDPLVVWTNGYAQLPVDRHAFKGAIPDLPFLRLVDDMRAEEMRKLYTYNTFHAALAYLGALRDHETIVACLADPAVRKAAEGALHESGAALQAAFGFSDAEMAAWLDGVVTQTANPALRDTVARYGADPTRKLHRADRLVGPLLLARRHGIPAPHLTQALAAAFLYAGPDDAGAAAVQEAVAARGLPAAIRELCELTEAEADLVAGIADAVTELAQVRAWTAWVRRAEARGFAYEQQYHGCGQCALAALIDTLQEAGVLDPDAAVAETAVAAATGFAGGMGQMGDGPCGAMLGAAMACALVSPRRRSHLDGDRDNKYRAYAMARALRERYIATYGGITCHDVQRVVLGRPFDLMDPDDREAFAAAGAHEDKCTAVVARAARWAMEIIGEQCSEITTVARSKP